MARPRVSPQSCPVGTKIQSLLLDKDRFKAPYTAKIWLKFHGFKRSLDEKPNTFRARQIEPTDFRKKSFRTITLGSGVKAVIGCPKKGV